MAVGAHVVPVLLPLRPVQLVRVVDALAGVEVEPALAAGGLRPRIPGDGQGLQPSAADVHEVLLQRVHAEGVAHLEIGQLPVRAVGAHHESPVAAEEPARDAEVREARVVEVAEHRPIARGPASRRRAASRSRRRIPPHGTSRRPASRRSRPAAWRALRPRPRPAGRRRRAGEHARSPQHDGDHADGGESDDDWQRTLGFKESLAPLGGVQLCRLATSIDSGARRACNAERSDGHPRSDRHDASCNAFGRIPCGGVRCASHRAMASAGPPETWDGLEYRKTKGIDARLRSAGRGVQGLPQPRARPGAGRLRQELGSEPEFARRGRTAVRGRHAEDPRRDGQRVPPHLRRATRGRRATTSSPSRWTTRCRSRRGSQMSTSTRRTP